MESQAELLEFIVGVLDDLGIPYAIGGSLAAMAYGEPRLTRDIDVVARLAPADAARLKARFPAPAFYLDLTNAEEAIRSGGTFNLIHPESGFKVDFFVAADELSLHQVEHARSFPTARGGTARFCPAEDLVLQKLRSYDQGGSDKHLRDIASIVQTQGLEFDRARVTSDAEQMGLGSLWSAIVRKVETG